MRRNRTATDGRSPVPSWNQQSTGWLVPYTGPTRTAPPLWTPVGTVLPRWSWFTVFLLAGAALCLGLLSIPSIGLLIAPLGLAAVLVLAGNRRSGPSWPGAVAGAAFPVWWVAWLNRQGPGWACGAGGACSDQLNPWILLGTGALLLVAGLAGFLLLRERAVRRQLLDQGDSWRPTGW